MKRVKKVIGIKSFDMDLKCRNFQFEIGKTYGHLGKLKIGYNGFHFYSHNQLKHVNNIPGTRYCLVIGEDVIMEDYKSVARKITILKELSLEEVIDIRHRKMVKQGISENQDEDVVIQSRYRGLVDQTGYRGFAIQTGDRGFAIQTGCRGLAGQTGYRGSAIQDGENGMAIATGIEGKAMVKNDKGAIVIQNWIYDDNGQRQVKSILSARVGDTLPNGEIMATNTWYWYEDGELKSKKFKI